MRKVFAIVAALGLAASISAAGVMSASATEDQPGYVTAAWEMPSWIDSTHPTWPQTLLTSVKTEGADLAALDTQISKLEVKCGETRQVQVDVYNDNEVTNTLLAGKTLTGPNTPPESLIEGSWGTAYKLVQVVGAKCETPPPAAVTCTVTGAGYTESDDAAPVATKDGYLFTGGSGKAVGYRWPVTGNLQGIGTISYDATGSTSVFYYRIVIDASADGGSSYQSVTVTSGSPITLASTAYVNHVGSMTLAAVVALYPNNKITSEGFHLDSGATAEDIVTLKSVTSPCGDLSFIPVPPTTKPPVVTPPTTTPPQTLAYTGAVTGGLVPIGAVLLALGVSGLLLKRKFS